MGILQSARSLEAVSRFLTDWSPARIEALLRCIDTALLRRRLREAGLCAADATDVDVLEAYFSHPACRVFSPNDAFDERFYRESNPDIASYVEPHRSGFLHFIEYGLGEGRWPSAPLERAAAAFAGPLPVADSLDEQTYLELNAAAQDFLDAFPILTAFDHYNRYGRFLHFAIVPPPAPNAHAMPAIFAAIEREFDAAWYAATYLAEPGFETERTDPFAHYLAVGAARSFSPNASFEEPWYRAFYADVERAIPEQIFCGFQHYIEIGRSERRMPRFDLAQALENQIPGVTLPELVPRVDGLRDRFYREGLRASRRRARDGETTVWFLLPQFNPDVAFGGYRACFELMRAVRLAGAKVAVYCTRSEHANMRYFLWRQTSDRYDRVFDDVRVLARDEDQRIGIGPHDRIVAYSVMDLHIARDLARWTDEERPYLLAQEYEPTYFEHSSSRVLFCEAYAVPHVPIINSRFLERYFREHRIGPFGAAKPPVRWDDYATFEHRINRLPHESASSMAARARRLLVLYARPERHANRNLFELGVLALQNLARAGAFGPHWSFVGIGAMSELEPIELGNGHRLVLAQRTSEEEYVRLMSALDIGISLMYAPHPGVVSFELATTGALVVTNTYENRSREDLIDICGNIVPCEPTLADLERAIREAIDRVPAFELRARDAYEPSDAPWDEIFSDDFVRRIFRFGVAARAVDHVAS
jgi:hypothetical protein